MVDTGDCTVNTRSRPQIVVRLKEAIERYSAESGTRLTYQALALRTGIARSTIESLATRRTYNASLKTVARLCEVLKCTPGDLLEFRIQDSCIRSENKT
jgi:DNA-binding Xre family transcriptional regulator